jgi:uncharacterized membrane protein
MSEDGANSPSGHPNQDLASQLAENTTTRGALIGDFYRAEVTRMVAWRSRLDQTTRWAVIVVAAILTWTFSSLDNPHYVLLIGMFGVTAFLFVEAHRYREYDIWRMRVRLLQKHVFVGVLSPETLRDTDWQSNLSESLSAPAFTMPFRDAVRHRLRRVYLPLLLLLLIAWLARITVFHPDETWRQTAAIPGLDGVKVVVFVVLFYVTVVGVALWSVRDVEVREFQE